MTDTQPTNGDLPPIREAIIEQGLRLSQEVAAERDSLRLLLAQRDTTIAGLKAQLDVAELDASRLRNRAESLMAVRDEAIAERAIFEALFISFQSLLRAFKIPGAPLIREATEDESPTIGGA
jgi:hypothetical protein